MPEPKIESTPVAPGGSPPIVTDLGSAVIVPEGESPAADLNGGSAGGEGGEGAGEAAGDKEAAAGTDDAGKAGGEGEKPAGEAKDAAAEGEKPADDPAKIDGDADAAAKEKAQADADAAAQLQQKRFLQMQTEAGKLARDQKKYKEDRKALDEREKTLKNKVDMFDNAARLAQTDPLALLQGLGISYEELTKKVLASKDLGAAELETVKSQVKKLEDEKEADKAAQVEKDAKNVAVANKAVLDNYFGRLRELVDKSDKYALVKAQGDEAIQTAINAAVHHYQNYKVMPTDDEVLAATEELLTEQAAKLLGTEKIQKLYPGLSAASGESDGDSEKPAGDEAGEKDEEADETVAKSATTLSNEMQGTGGARKTPRLKERDASVADASKLLNWEEPA